MQEKKTFKPCDLVIFGVLGDLSCLKLLVSLYQLERDVLIETETQIIGIDIHQGNNDLLINTARESIEKHIDDIDESIWQRFSARLTYLKIDVTQPKEFLVLNKIVDKQSRVMVNYLSVPPALFEPICKGLDSCGVLNAESLIVMEKPLGYDLESSRNINDAVAKVFAESQICRIDHYLGKETVLNLLALRFANALFTTNWNHNTIDHIQITVAEEVGIEDRWDYFDNSGQLRDMLQNHLLQILTLIAMEPPGDLEAESIRNEKIKVLKALRPITAANITDTTVRGQYTEGFLKGKKVPGYQQGGDISHTESFVALRVDIDNWRWAGVPFYLRTGKRMVRKRSEIVIYFKGQPHNIFQDSFIDLPPNKLVLDLQPGGGITFEMLNKVPGLSDSIKLQKNELNLSDAGRVKISHVIGAYERLLLEAMRGNQTLFISREEIEASWQWVDGIHQAWQAQNQAPKPYTAGSTWGADASVALIAKDGREWE